MAYFAYGCKTLTTHKTREMNTKKETEDDGYDENDVVSTNDTKKNKAVLKKDKAAKVKRTKHKYIPRVWFEGKKMIIRGKAELQLSNEEIHLKMKDKDKKKKLDRDNEATNSAVMSGKQSTLSNFVTVKRTKNQPTKMVSAKTMSVKNDDHVHDSSDEYEISSTDDCEDYIYLQQEKDPMNNDISSSTQTSIINYANKESSPDEEE